MVMMWCAREGDDILVAWQLKLRNQVPGREGSEGWVYRIQDTYYSLELTSLKSSPLSKCCSPYNIQFSNNVRHLAFKIFTVICFRDARVKWRHWESNFIWLLQGLLNACQCITLTIILRDCAQYHLCLDDEAEGQFRSNMGIYRNLVE